MTLPVMSQTSKQYAGLMWSCAKAFNLKTNDWFDVDRNGRFIKYLVSQDSQGGYTEFCYTKPEYNT